MSKDPKSTYYDVNVGNPDEPMETIEIIRAKLTPEQFDGFCLGNALKYACRYNFKHRKFKDKIRDIDKIQHCIKFMRG